MKKNLTALNRIKNQVNKIVGGNENRNGGKNKTQNVTDNKMKNTTKVDNVKITYNKTNGTRIKRRVTARENLDDLLPALSIRSVNINLDWFNFAKSSNVTQIGTAFVLYDGKNLISHVMNVGNFGNYYTISNLEQDRIYRGEIKLLTEKEEVKNFIRKQSDGKNIEEFELTTPFIVSGNFQMFQFFTLSF